MFSMKRLPLLLLMLAGGIFLTMKTMGSDNNTPPSKYERILQSIHVILTQGHYKPKDINDDFSKKVFTKFLEDLDTEKNIFLQEDIKADLGLLDFQKSLTFFATGLKANELVLERLELTVPLAIMAMTLTAILALVVGIYLPAAAKEALGVTTGGKVSIIPFE